MPITPLASPCEFVCDNCGEKTVCMSATAQKQGWRQWVKPMDLNVAPKHDVLCPGCAQVISAAANGASSA